MTELERQGKKAEAAAEERDSNGQLPPVKLHDPHRDDVTGWSPSEWRRSTREPEESGE